ncbi:hypothetical protein LCGC14_2977020, partial [marine sediment metagenome]
LSLLTVGTLSGSQFLVDSSGNTVIGGDLTFNNEILPDGSLCTNNQILRKFGADDWRCADEAAATVLDYFLSNVDSGFTDTNIMYDREQGLAESSHASSTLPEGDDQLLFTFMTSSTSTVPSVLLPGIYDIHVHLDRTGGNRTTTLYWTLTASSTDDTQTVLMTSEDSAEITNTKAAFTFHAVLATETDLTTGDRLVLKIYGDLGGGANTEITIFHDGTTDSHLAILTTSEVFNDIYLRNDGTNPLTANWNAGSFDITASTFIGALTGNADTVTTNANLTGEITSTGNATVIVESFLQENGASELTGETLGTACAENEILKTNATGGLDCAADATGGGALGQLGELTDVSTTTLAAGYIIFRNSDNTSWN